MTEKPVSIKSYSFKMRKQQQALSILNLLQNSEKIESDALKKHVTAFMSKEGGFSYQLGRFFAEHGFLDNNTVIFSNDVNAIAQSCQIEDRTKGRHRETYLLIDTNKVEILSPGVLGRLNKTPDTHYHPARETPKNTLAPL